MNQKDFGPTKLYPWAIASPLKWYHGLMGSSTKSAIPVATAVESSWSAVKCLAMRICEIVVSTDYVLACLFMSPISR